MKRTVLSVTLTALLAGGTGAAIAGPGNGAQRSGLAASSGLAPLNCAAADPAEAGTHTANGFVVLNAPGRPARSGKNAKRDRTHKLIGELVLRRAEPGTYDVRLADGGGCGTVIGAMTVNEKGTGHFSFQDTGKGAGTWNVVLTQPLVVGQLPVDVQRYASAPVTLR